MERILLGRVSSGPGSRFLYVKFLTYKHSVRFYRDDIMLTLQIVPGEIVPGKNMHSHVNPGSKAPLPGKRPLPPPILTVNISQLEHTMISIEQHINRYFGG